MVLHVQMTAGCGLKERQRSHCE